MNYLPMCYRAHFVRFCTAFAAHLLRVCGVIGESRNAADVLICSIGNLGVILGNTMLGGMGLDGTWTIEGYARSENPAGARAKAELL